MRNITSKKNRERIIEFINTMSFSNQKEKDQFLDFLSPILKGRLSFFDILFLQFKKFNFFIKIINRFDFKESFFLYQTSVNDTDSKSYRNLSLIISFIKYFLGFLFTLIFIFSSSPSLSTHYFNSSVFIFMIIAAICSLKEYKSKIISKMSIKILTKSSLMAQFLSLIGKRNRPVNKNSIQVKYDELKLYNEENNIGQIIENNSRGKSVYFLNKDLLTYQNKSNLLTLLFFIDKMNGFSKKDKIKSENVKVSKNTSKIIDGLK